MKKIISVLLGFYFFYGLSFKVLAEDNLSWQRQQFKLALASIEQNKWDQVRQYADDLFGYPLTNFLHYRYLQAHLHQLSQTEIAAFLGQHQADFMGQELNYAWLNHLIRNKDWQGLEHAYTPQNSERLRCYYLFGRLEQIKTQPELSEQYDTDIISIGKALWRVGKSQHQACDPVFEYLDQQQIFGDDLIWQRLNLAVQAGKSGLARYLGTKLEDKERQNWALHWQELPNNPHSVLKKIYLKHIPEQVDSSIMIAYGIKHLAKKQADQAATHWQKFQDKLQFSPAQRRHIKAEIAMRSAFQQRSYALERLQALTGKEHNKSTEQLLIQILLKTSDWAAIETAIKSFSSKGQARSKWRYWLARALDAQGKNKAAQDLFSRLAQERNFYGFLTAERLGLAYPINHHTIKRNDQQLYIQAPELSLAREFYYFDLLTEAKRSWDAGLQHLNQVEKAQASALARSWNWYDQAIITAARARAYDDIYVRFPLAYHEQIQAASQEQALDEAWIYGIIRQESAFMRTVISKMGANGLMQLMPATQKLMAKKIGLALEDEQIFDSSHNIRLGSAYLKHLLDKFAGSYLLATIAYNAGPGRAQRWWKNKQNIPVDMWIELIPFKETRRYVKQVMLYTALYEHQLGRKISPLRLDFPIPKLKIEAELSHPSSTH